MDKTRFITLLSEKLSEELPHQLVLSNIAYYEGYINGEIAKGRLEEEVMEELGDPYMIARTIIDAQTGEAFEHHGYTEDVYTEPADAESDDTLYTGKKVNHSCLITAIIIILIVVAILTVLGSVISFLWPVLGPVLLILLIVSVLSDKRR